MKLTTVFTAGLLAAALAIAGCETKSDSTPTKSGDKKGNEHPHGTGPNGGVVFDLGKHHAEFTVNHDAKECTILFIREEDKKPEPTAVKDLTVVTKPSKTKDGKEVPAMTIKMLPKDEKDGKASKYVGSDPVLTNVADFEGSVTALIEGKPAKGEFKE